jgi:hypothetical protein
MSQARTELSGATKLLVAVPVGRNTWISKKATLHYEGKRLIKAEGIELTQAGPRGVTGTLYIVKESLCRDHCRVMRVERQKVVDGQVVDTQNWGEIEDTGPRAA